MRFHTLSWATWHLAKRLVWRLPLSVRLGFVAFVVLYTLFSGRRSGRWLGSFLYACVLAATLGMLAGLIRILLFPNGFHLLR